MVASRVSAATIAFVGDVNFTGRIGDAMAQNGVNWAFEGVTEPLEAADLTVANLESPAGIGGAKYCDKRVYFRADPDNLDALVYAGFDLVSLANNHALDYGPDVLKQTMAALDQRDIKYAGIVSSNKERNKPVIIDIKGVKVAFLSYCNACPSEFGPRSGTAGVSVGLGEWIRKQVAETRKQGVDFIIAMPHWGSEYFGVDKNQRYTCRVMREAGVDVIIGAHPHVLQQVEMVDHTLVAWSLGNFLFPMGWFISLDSAILNVHLEKGKPITWDVTPVNLKSGRPQIEVKNSPVYKRIKYITSKGYEYNNKRGWPEHGPWEDSK